MLITCQIDWSEVGVAFEMQCFRNCTLSSLYCFDPFKANYYIMEESVYTHGYSRVTIRLAVCRVSRVRVRVWG